MIFCIVETLENRMTKWGPYLIFLAAMLWVTDAPFRYHLTQNLGASFIVLAEHAINVLLILPFIFLGWREVRSLKTRLRANATAKTTASRLAIPQLLARLS